ncbi:predicted protein [Nematostella vectensis]|uniref:MOSC domain-containing protein n=2 Tax=Nematostella vectensis TaxID=45351 RepID=A7SKU9_NEMVE|nr:predicted protein [Nematostella vectensis]|eukprot:XP_001627780.1 predicted protein [Nematostella vectensis]
MSALPKALLVCVPAAVASSIALLYWYKTRKRAFRPSGHVSGLYIYPIKSCKGIPLDSALCLTEGLQYDRRWVIVNDKNVVLTQRQYPSLALVSPRLEEGGQMLCVDAPGMSTLNVRLPLTTSDHRNIEVFGLVGEGRSAGAEASVWFSKYLEKPGCKLFYMTRPRFLQDDKDWGEECLPEDKASFGDFAPLLVVTMETLIALNKELDSPVSIRRFRPNIIISGVPACAEDNWKLINIRDVQIRKIKNCDRCVLTTVDPDLGKKSGNEPLATLKRTRMPADRDPRYGDSPFFGIHTVVDNTGNIQVGDPVEARC